MAGPSDHAFDPREPNVDLWQRLLMKYPGKGNGRKKTNKEKREIALQMQNYYLDHAHPRKGKPFKNEE